MNTENYNWWAKPNQEGVSNKDVILVMIAGIVMISVLVGMWYLITIK